MQSGRLDWLELVNRAYLHITFWTCGFACRKVEFEHFDWDTVSQVAPLI